MRALAIQGYFDGYALSIIDSAPPGLVPIPEPANVLLLSASFGVFFAMGIGGCQYQRVTGRSLKRPVTGLRFPGTRCKTPGGCAHVPD
jgi:hypothetical protein